MGPSVFNAASERMDAVAQVAMAAIVKAAAVAMPKVLRIFVSMGEQQAELRWPQAVKQDAQCVGIRKQCLDLQGCLLAPPK